MFVYDFWISCVSLLSHLHHSVNLNLLRFFGIQIHSKYSQLRGLLRVEIYLSAIKRKTATVRMECGDVRENKIAVLWNVRGIPPDSSRKLYKENKKTPWTIHPTFICKKWHWSKQHVKYLYCNFLCVNIEEHLRGDNSSDHTSHLSVNTFSALEDPLRSKNCRKYPSKPLSDLWITSLVWTKAQEKNQDKSGEITPHQT